jgi:dynein heavy chain, axonemal
MRAAHLARLASCPDFGALPAAFPPLMHTLLLVWRHSRHYNTPARLGVLLRQIANAVIASARAQLSGRQVLELLAEDGGAAAAVAKLRATASVCVALKRAFAATKARAGVECPDRPWRALSSAAVFGRLDAFLARLHHVTELAAAAAQYAKLDRLVVGGAKGSDLASAVEHVAAGYRDALAAVEAVPYDLLDIDGGSSGGGSGDGNAEHGDGSGGSSSAGSAGDERLPAGGAVGTDPAAAARAAAARFAADYRMWQARVADLDRRLASVLTGALDGCANVYGRFKLLDAFEGLLERPAIQVGERAGRGERGWKERGGGGGRRVLSLSHTLLARFTPLLSSHTLPQPPLPSAGRAGP